MEPIVWTADMAVGIAAMDLAHRALFDQIARLLERPERDFEQLRAVLVEHLETDFREEEALMERFAYPALSAHREQHARVLATLHSLTYADADTARRALLLLARWFQVHVLTMDVPLALALQAGGAASAPPAAAGSTLI